MVEKFAVPPAHLALEGGEARGGGNLKKGKKRKRGKKIPFIEYL